MRGRRAKLLRRAADNVAKSGQIADKHQAAKDVARAIVELPIGCDEHGRPTHTENHVYTQHYNGAARRVYLLAKRLKAGMR